MPIPLWRVGHRCSRLARRSRKLVERGKGILELHLAGLEQEVQGAVGPQVRVSAVLDLVGRGGQESPPSLPSKKPCSLQPKLIGESRQRHKKPPMERDQMLLTGFSPSASHRGTIHPTLDYPSAF